MILTLKQGINNMHPWHVVHENLGGKVSVLKNH